MATSTTTSTSGKRNRTAPKSRPGRQSAASKVAPAADEIVKLTRWLEAARVRAVAVKLLARRRKDLETVIAANRKSFEGIQAVVKRQTELLKAQIGEWRSVGKVMAVAGAARSIAQFDELAKGAFLLSLANVKELALLSVNTQAEAFKLVHQRIRQDIAEIGALLDGE